MPPQTEITPSTAATCNETSLLCRHCRHTSDYPGHDVPEPKDNVRGPVAKNLAERRFEITPVRVTRMCTPSEVAKPLNEKDGLRDRLRKEWCGVCGLL